MKRVKANKVARRRSGGDEILPEYDFSRARPNKYAARYAKGSIEFIHSSKRLDAQIVFHHTRSSK